MFDGRFADHERFGGKQHHYDQFAILERDNVDFQ
jgi:hypothetical protein